MIRFIFLLIFFLTACSNTTIYAPVSSATIEPIPKKGFHRVQRRETLYSIAWRYGLDYRMIAKRNRILSPYSIHTGQILFLKGNPPALSPAKRPPLSLKPIVELNEPNLPVKEWAWPARGRIIGRFSDSNKGVNIAGKLGDPIYASSGGKIVYSGNGLRAYGNLIIIKHNSDYLSAYAYNQAIFVKGNDWVKKGQKIANMGYNGSNRAMLHFEIRRKGQPVDPLHYLK